MKILLLEDQTKMATFIKRGLLTQNYLVDHADSLESANLFFESNQYDLVILDVGLPDGSGFDFAKHLRTNAYTGSILFLTARSETKDKIQGLDSGGDDYLTKPFEIEELFARIRALLRRVGQIEISKLKYEDIEMDLVLRKVKRDNLEITLTNKEFSLLEYFLRNPDRPLTRMQISENVWDINFDTNTNVVDVYINMLRKKLDQNSKPKLIHTMVGYGYILKK